MFCRICWVSVGSGLSTSGQLTNHSCIVVKRERDRGIERSLVESMEACDEGLMECERLQIYS